MKVIKFELIFLQRVGFKTDMVSETVFNRYSNSLINVDLVNMDLFYAKFANTDFQKML